MDERNKIIIFSGTTEGRQLSEKLNKRAIDHTVCVATEYGEMLQPSGDHILVEEGRKDLPVIRSMVENALVVVDATHPYATLVSENIRTACMTPGDGGMGSKSGELHNPTLLRVLRDPEGAGEDVPGVEYYDSAEQCRDALSQVRGNILFTTGSKELAGLSSGVADKSRVYARVLPSGESLKLCEEAGVRNDHVIALQGPFSKELNLALLRQYSIDVLVTKDSGRTGGFREKIDACKEAGVKVMCIRRPAQSEGISCRQAIREIEKLLGISKQILGVNIIGIGMGSREGLTLEADAALKRSELVFGARRLLDGIEGKRTYPYYLADDIIPVLESAFEVESCLEVAVLFSGDIGFYSGAQKFEKELTDWGKIKPIIHCYPGISSVSFLSSRLGISYSDADIISLHGRNDDRDILSAARQISYARKTFLLMSSGDDVKRLAVALAGCGVRARIVTGRNLSYDSEEIREFLPGQDIDIEGKGLFTLFVDNQEPAERKLIPYIDDEEFTRNKTPMTKALIRHEAIRLLGLREGDVFYDIGSGTGSIAIEAAGLSASLKVFSFEKDADAIAVQKENIEKFGAGNITLIEGMVPQTLEKAEDAPDAVFIGGSGGQLGAVIDYIKALERPVRVVVTAITMETMSDIIKLKDDPDIRDLEIQQITGSRTRKAGDYNLMKTENSVMVAAFNL